RTPGARPGSACRGTWRADIPAGAARPGGRGVPRAARPAQAAAAGPSCGRAERRESEVLDLLRRGLSTAEIADRLDISPVTVRRHVGLLLQKLGVKTRAAALSLVERSER